jgi:DNA-binding beta-propeller fold protein YncE
MVQMLLLCMMLFQAGTQTATKPVIDNDRVAVLDVSSATPGQPTDAVVVSPSGNAVYVPKGATSKISGRLFVIVLKDHPVSPIENKSGYQLAFPRPGTKKLFENDRVIVWDSTWTLGVATPMHFHDKHDKDVVVVFLDDGDLKSTTLDGREVVNKYTTGTVRFNQRDRIHTETLMNGKQRAIITELK